MHKDKGVPREPTEEETTPTTTPPPNLADYEGPLQVVPGEADGGGQINVTDYSGQLVTDPSLGLTQDDPATSVNESMFLSERNTGMDPNAAGTNIDPNQDKYQMDAGGVQADTNQVDQTATAQQVDPRLGIGYDPTLTQENVEQNAMMTGAQGSLSEQAEVDAAQADMQGLGTGINQDGSVNYTGAALQEFATQDLNTVDKKATVLGQIEALQEQFRGPNGEPVIPSWAAATARSVAKIAAFRGMTGTAATAAMAQALLEASLPIAQQDAQFYQTLTLTNLSNKQQQILNRANVLSKMDQMNLDNRMAAAITNAKSFMEMDMANLNNDQQARLINTQSRVQSILEDAKSANAAKVFGGEMAMYYDNLSAAIEQFNATQTNAMAQFNTGEANAQERFNSELETAREQFYKSMQYQIDLANAKWRQQVTLTEDSQAFEAAATDVKNLVGLSVESLNQLWDRSDALLDYLWKSTENQLDRKAAMAIEKFRAKAAADAADDEGWGNIFGTVAGKLLGGIFD